jgi:flagellar protein FlgJ
MDGIINNLSSVYANSTYTNSTTNSLTSKLSSTDLSEATDDELMSVCKEFESYFVEQVMKSMAKMASVDGSTSDNNVYASLFGLSDDSDSSMSTLSSYFGDELVSSMASQLTESKTASLGLAEKLYEQMKRNTTSITSVDEV